MIGCMVCSTSPKAVSKLLHEYDDVGLGHGCWKQGKHGPLTEFQGFKLPQYYGQCVTWPTLKKCAQIRNYFYSVAEYLNNLGYYLNCGSRIKYLNRPTTSF